MKLLYFAWLKTKTGVAEEEVELPAEVATVAELLGWLKDRGPKRKTRTLLWPSYWKSPASPSFSGRPGGKKLHTFPMPQEVLRSIFSLWMVRPHPS